MVDAHVSEACGSNPVEVQVLFSAHTPLQQSFSFASAKKASID